MCFPASPQTVLETEKMSQIAFYFLLDAAFLASSLLQMKQSCPYKIRISTMHVRNTSQVHNSFCKKQLTKLLFDELKHEE